MATAACLRDASAGFSRRLNAASRAATSSRDRALNGVRASPVRASRRFGFTLSAVMHSGLVRRRCAVHAMFGTGITTQLGIALRLLRREHLKLR